MRCARVLVILVLLAGCASTRPWVGGGAIADRLFCGLATTGGGEVSEEEWRAFVREEVMSRFPDGLTLWRAEGTWRNKDGAIVREPVLVIEIVHRHDAAIEREILEIAEAWKVRFRQEAVLRVAAPATMQLIE